jgi:hypothetical protein
METITEVDSIMNGSGSSPDFPKSSDFDDLNAPSDNDIPF